MPRRSYDQYCALSRSLDVVGERWTLLIVRELLTGPCRYTDLHADLPGVSTDILAARLKAMESDGLVTRRRLPPPGAATVYELTSRGRALVPALTALAEWGTAELEDPRPTDALRAHWFALPVMRRLTELAAPHHGVVNVRIGEGGFHVLMGTSDPARYGHGLAESADAQITLDTPACVAFARGEATLTELVKDGRATIDGATPLAGALRGQ
jgi:DNA-binding HxlR family transcriptional regulator